ncbi:MAG: hypothetical protein HS116_20380 [Planctomycetes bacterium]|nr:hypothetical protein [Planctomycetota bacterium]
MPLFTRRTPSSRLQRLMEKAPLVVAFFGLGAFGQAQAATYNVDTTTDGLPPANVSLREAIIAANGGGATDIINVPAGTYVLSYGGALENLGFGGDLDITHTSGTLTIEGAGQGVTVISAFGYNDRVMHKIGNGTLILRNLTLYGGIARDNGADATSALGGGLLAEGGSVILDNVQITQCQAFGASGADATSPGQGGENGAGAMGGGLYTAGSSLQVINGSVLSYCNALAGDGGDGSAAPSSVGGFGGEGGLAAGGGIFALSGTVTITESAVGGNFAFGGDGGDGRTGGDENFTDGQPGGTGGNGGAALGGGLFVDNGAGTVLIDGSDFTSNRVYGGAGGAGGRGGDFTGAGSNSSSSYGSAGPGGGGGGGGDVQGGGLWINNGAGTVTITDTDIQFSQGVGGFGGQGAYGGNSSNNFFFDGGNGGFGGRGGEAKAAGLYLGEGLGNRVVTLDDLYVYGNSLTAGGGGAGGIGGDATNGSSADGGAGGQGGEGNNADGGGIWAGSGTVTISNSDIESNFATGGRGGTGGNGGTGSNNADSGGNGGEAGSGRGGGLWASTSATISINNSTILSNSVSGNRGGGGGQGGDGTGDSFSSGIGGNGGNGGSGGSGLGGGIFQVGNGALVVDNSTISSNSANASYGGNGGTGGTGTSNGSPGRGGSGGAGGSSQGGGLYFGGSGTLTISDTTVSGNSLGSNGDGGNGGNGGTTTSSTNSGLGGFGGNAGANEGGGIWINGGGTVTVERSTVSNNLALTGANGGNAGSGDSFTSSGSPTSPQAGDGGTVRGGGIYVTGGAPVIRNCTISGNMAYGGGNGGSGAVNGSDGTSQGGGLYGYGTLNLLNSTFANNNANAYGGGIFHEGGGLDASSILVGDNFAGLLGYDALAYFTTIGYSLIENGYGHNVTDGVNGNIVGQDATLGGLADNGGPTQTHAIDNSSVAYNTGANTGGLGTDQRGIGFSRVGDGQADIGAFEFQVTTPAGNLDVRSLRISNVFRYPNKDQIILVLRFDNPGAVPPPRTPYPFAGLAVAFDIGGATFNFTLDDRGRSGTQCKAKYLKRTNQIELRLNTGKGDFHDNFADEGLTDQRIVGQIFNVPVAFQFDSTAGSGLVPVKYTCFSPSAGNGVGKGVLPPP